MFEVVVLPSLSGDCIQRGVLSSLSGDCIQRYILPSLSGDCIQRGVLSLSGDCIQRYVLPSLSGDYIQRGNQISIFSSAAVVGILWEASFYAFLDSTDQYNSNRSLFVGCTSKQLISGSGNGRLSIKYPSVTVHL